MKESAYRFVTVRTFHDSRSSALDAMFLPLLCIRRRKHGDDVTLDGYLCRLVALSEPNCLAISQEYDAT